MYTTYALRLYRDRDKYPLDAYNSGDITGRIAEDRPREGPAAAKVYNRTVNIGKRRTAT
jgi:hypothetical protein